jgi:hypothetical protein
MTVSTEGPIRGLLGRWVMRFEAAGAILRLGFQGTTAVSALSGVLAYTGFGGAVPFVVALGVPAVFVFAYAYVELGIYNRKNRERDDRGNNYAKPLMRIDDELIAKGIVAGIKERPLNKNEDDAIESELDRTFEKHRNGIEIEQ